MGGTSYRPAYAADEDPRQQRIERERAQPPRRSQRILNSNQANVARSNQSQVDSWRSFRNDDNSLQSMLMPTSAYDPTTRLFIPPPSATAVSAQPLPDPRLRGTGGFHGHLAYRSVQPSAGPANSTHPASGWNVAPRVPHQFTRQFSTSADIPIPSVEHATDAVAAGQKTPPWRKISGRNTPSRSTPRGNTPKRQSITPPPAPRVSDAYLAQAKQLPTQSPLARPLLVVLDLNGTLLDRPSRNQPTKFHLRPGVTPFLDYLFANHHVMIYSSARPENVKAMVEAFLLPKQRDQLLAVWARDKLGLKPQQYNNKVQVYKNLNQVWAAQEIRIRAAKLGVKWNQTNTVLIDDSVLKAAGQPHNIVLVPEFKYNPPKADKGLMQEWIKTELDAVLELRQKLEELKGYTDVSQVIRQWQEGTVEGAEVQEVLLDEKKSSQPAPNHIEKQGQLQTTQLLTPISPIVEISSDDEVELKAGQLVTSTRNIGGSNAKSTSQVDQEDKNHLRTRRAGTVSPITEDVFKDLLSGGKQTRSGETGRVPLTPESVRDNEV